MESEVKSRQSSKQERLGQLDGLRALAIFGVMLHHFGVKPSGWLDWGPVAPTVFFMLSGFLITGSLERMRASGGADAWGIVGFHLRRFARLVPALYILLVVGWLAGLAEYREGLLPHALFASNIQMALSGEWAGSLSHLWSLSMQEQFYLLWPLLLFLPSRWLPYAIAGIAFSALTFRVVCIHVDAPEMFRWLMLPGSLDAFAAGGLLALAFKAKRQLMPSGWVLPTGCLALTCWLVARAFRHLDGTGSILVAFVDTLEILAFAWLIIAIIQFPNCLCARLLASRPLAAVGRLSYGLFIWHMLVASALIPHLDAFGLTVDQALLLRTTILVAVSFLMAFLSWIALEKPCIAWAGAFASSPKATALMASCRSLTAKFSALMGSARSSGGGSV